MTLPDAIATDHAVSQPSPGPSPAPSAHEARARGLTSTEAEARLAELGPNEPAPVARQALVTQILRRFANPLVAVLLVASVVSALVHDVVNAAIIITMVVLSMTLEFVQTFRSQKAADALRVQVVPTATAQRDGVFRELPRRELVPGDLIRLTAGDMVPADADLIDAKDLHVQEAALTGESLPVEKEPAPAQGEPTQANRVWLGSSVVSGMATAVVRTTGARTSFGQIAQALARRPPATEFERGIVQFGVFITKTVVLLVLGIFTIAAAFRRDALEALLFAVALAVGLTPEFLPMITTVTLARGALRMSRRHVIVKNLAAIQNLGSIDIVCSDKTGTLTSGEMILEEHVDPSGQRAPRPAHLAYINSYFETGVDNPLDEAILRKANVNPLDAAVLRHERFNMDAIRKLDEVPFDFERRRVSVVVEDGDRREIIVKGAPEHVLAASTAYEVGGVVSPLDEAARARCDATFRALSASGYRVLAVAYRAVPPQPVYGKEDERDLVLAGYLAFVDPPLEGAREATQALKAQGVDVKILTGDNELVTRHVCERVGVEAGEIVTGADLDHMSDPALAAVAERTRVFARMSPAQKNRIITLLKARGHVVGYMGDGINDAPSLHTADVGISVANAVDVAKDAADVILLDRHLNVLLAGILEGRRAFGNVMKYLMMGTSSNFGNMFSMAGAYLFLPFLPMLPTQILLNNFLYDLAQVAIPTDNVDARFMAKPHRWNIDGIRRFMVLIGPLSSLYDFLTFYVLLHFFRATAPIFHTGWFVESLATQTLVIFVIRTSSNPLRSRPSTPLTALALAIVALAALLPFSPLAPLLGFTPLPAMYFAFVALATATYLLLVEAVKRALVGSLFDTTPAPRHPSSLSLLGKR